MLRFPTQLFQQQIQEGKESFWLPAFEHEWFVHVACTVYQGLSVLSGLAQGQSWS
jgi:hypothetical protein